MADAIKQAFKISGVSWLLLSIIDAQQKDKRLKAETSSYQLCVRARESEWNQETEIAW